MAETCIRWHMHRSRKQGINGVRTISHCPGSAVCKASCKLALHALPHSCNDDNEQAVVRDQRDMQSSNIDESSPSTSPNSTYHISQVLVSPTKVAACVARYVQL